MRPRIYGKRSPLGTWSWRVCLNGPLPLFFWTWEAAVDCANELVLQSRKINHLHLWS